MWLASEFRRVHYKQICVFLFGVGIAVLVEHTDTSYGGI